jgi:hypothetical protein
MIKETVSKIKNTMIIFHSKNLGLTLKIIKKNSKIYL